MEKHSGLAGKRILVVDDVDINRELAFHIMSSWGCLVDVAADGVAGLEMLQKGEYDLVLMDIQMPLMDGLETTRQVRQMGDQCKSSVPVVALTANLGHGDSREYLEAGMDDCLSKPFTEPELLAVVRKNVRKKKPGEERQEEVTERFVAGGPVGGSPDGLKSDGINSGSREGLLHNGAKVSTDNLSRGGVSDGLLAGVAKAPGVAGGDSLKAGGAAAPLYNLALVTSISGGDPAFVEKMLKLFLDTVPETLGNLAAAAEGGSWQAASKLAHKLKSTVDSMGITSLKNTVRRIERDARQPDNPDELRQMTREVIVTMHLVMAQVKEDYGL